MRVHKPPGSGHGHNDVPDDASRPRSEGPQVLSGLLPGTDPLRPVPQHVAVAAGHLSGQVRVAVCDVQVGQAGLPGHGDDVAGELAVGAQVDAVVGVGVDHAVIGTQDDPGAGRDAADQLGHGGIEALELCQPLLTEPAVLVAGLVQLTDVEVHQGRAAAQCAGGQTGPILQTIGSQVRGTPQGRLGQAGAGEAGWSDAHRAPCGKALEDRGNVLPCPRAGSVVTLPGDEAEDLVGAGDR